MAHSDKVMALARVAYERWVEGKEGVIATPAGLMGLPPWENKESSELELPEQDKQVWARVALATIAAGWGDTKDVVTITPEMKRKATETFINNTGEAGVIDEAMGIALSVALDLAGFTVVDA